MKYGICNLSIVPVRAKPEEASEMTTQLLFGEIIELEGTHKGWAKIRTVYDNYPGWLDLKQIHEISEETFTKFKEFSPNLTLDLIGILENVSEDFIFPIVMGSSLPYVVNNIFYIENTKYKYEAQITDNNKKGSVDDLINNAYMYLYTPYLWGGKSPFGIDCSGFTQMALRLTGINIQRDAAQQAENGLSIDFLTQAGAGDIAFFENAEGKIVHTGILLEKNKIIHASGQVRIDSIDHQGIFNHSLKKYTHKLRLIKRMIN